MTRIIDSHCHIYPEKIAHKAVIAIDDFYGGISGHHHDGTTETLIESGKEVGITHFVVHSVATTPHQVSSINHFIADAVENAGGAFTGLGALHPESDTPEEDFKQILDLGLCGVKLHPDIQQFQADSTEAFRLYEMIEDSGLPVLVHAGDSRYDYSNPDRIAHILKAFPRLKLVAAHLGGYSVWEEAVLKLSDFPNVWVDTSSSFPFLEPQRAGEIIREFGTDKVMFGTDYPLWVQSPDLEYMKELNLTEEEEERIYWANCADLYNMEF